MHGQVGENFILYEEEEMRVMNLPICSPEMNLIEPAEETRTAPTPQWTKERQLKETATVDQGARDYPQIYFHGRESQSIGNMDRYNGRFSPDNSFNFSPLRSLHCLERILLSKLSSRTSFIRRIYQEIAHSQYFLVTYMGEFPADSVSFEVRCERPVPLTVADEEPPGSYVERIPARSVHIARAHFPRHKGRATTPEKLGKSWASTIVAVGGRKSSKLDFKLHAPTAEEEAPSQTEPPSHGLASRPDHPEDSHAELEDMEAGAILGTSTPNA
ncbi:unnamed protein product [Nezara viridula]|uniref:Uncharacterized protein n=1 Tax=Nezara viridula TaxID=85310 RepID=A0A9P0HDI1_NEZVI|nr:unnamed protein product [Nezara viridula]